MGSVQFGVFVPQFKTDVAGMRERAIAAEEAGFDSFWVMDHLLVPAAPPTGNLESWTLLTALAGATSTLRLGHLVGCNPFRHPVLLAKMAATFDQVSGGRLDLGLGWGSAEDELRDLGFGPATRRGRSEALAETLQILRLMFAGEPFDYEGRHFRLKGAYGLPRPVQQRVPIHIGGGGRTLTMPLVAEYADWWNCLGQARHRLEELATLRGDARISAQYAVGLASTKDAVDAVAAATARRMPEDGWGRALVGTPEVLAAQLVAERERGVELFVLRFHDFGDPATLSLFGKEVAPALRGA
ncbi:LLM class flavin-dependent oxidoreductase [Actinomadura sp. SCN-SB]|uniref:LLM class flavin-dependent oxidoreductase n=1 Tax=Actinomadura sp. SCN-SB TaxID=3373092 RepID=UPI003752C757